MKWLRHKHLLDSRWMKIYLFGSFCAIEVDIRWFGHRTITLQFFTKTKGKFNCFVNPY